MNGSRSATLPAALPSDLALDIQRCLGAPPGEPSTSTSTSTDVFSSRTGTSLSEQLNALFPSPASLSPAAIEVAQARLRSQVEAAREEVERLTAELRDEQDEVRMSKVQDLISVSSTTAEFTEMIL